MTRDATARVRTFAMALGWFSIGLGLADLLAPRRMTRLIGATPGDDRTVTLLRAYGAREVGSGVAILAQPGQARWMWTRVGGDALDLATLGYLMSSARANRRRAMLAVGAVAGVTALDVLVARQLHRQALEAHPDRRPARRRPARGWREKAGGRVVEAITVNQAIERVEERWAHIESLPESLRTLSRLQQENAEHATVQFRPAPSGRGTEVRVEIRDTPRNAVGAAMGRLLGTDLAGRLRHDLRRFKQLVETGEVLLSEGPSLRRPGQPAEHPDEIRRAAGLGVV